MSKETDKIINKIKTDHLKQQKTKELGGEMVKKRAEELLNDFDLTNEGESKFKAIKFLKFLLNKANSKCVVDPDKHIFPHISIPNSDDAFLVLERNLTTGKLPYNESTKGLGSSDYTYTEVMALGYKKTKNGILVGIFGRKDGGDFNPKDAGMLFTETVSEEKIIPTLALAMASYEYNKGKSLNDQVTFPSEI